jgi:hypothetical protein
MRGLIRDQKREYLVVPIIIRFLLSDYNKPKGGN